MSNESNMQNDHFLAEMLEIMRSQGKKDNPVTLQLGVMLSANSVKIDDLVLYAEDLYIADYLVAGYTRKIKVPYVSDVEAYGKGVGNGVGTGEGVVEGTTCKTQVKTNVNTDVTITITEPKEETITYIDGLKKDDIVAVQKLSDTNKYVILARVVSA